MPFLVVNLDGLFCRLQAYARAVSVIQSRDKEGVSAMSAGEVEILEAAMHAGYEQFLRRVHNCLLAVPHFWMHRLAKVVEAPVEGLAVP